jgi:rhamnosyltransferase
MVFNAKLASIIQGHKFPDKFFMHDEFLARVCVAVGGKIIFDHDVHIKYRQHEDNVIGSTVGNLDAIKRRVLMIKERSGIGIADELLKLSEIYSDRIDRDRKNWIDKIINYKDSLLTRLSLALSNKTNFTSMNMRMTIGLKILLGNM